MNPIRRSLPKSVAISAACVAVLAALVVPGARAEQATASPVPPIDPPTLKTNPNGEEYLIGAIAWPGFKQGTHSGGWRRLQHYPDREPLLGFYDQDSAEVWDWHIKNAKEHGLSYFAFVWDRGSEPGQPVTHPLRGHSLAAFKQSQFSGQMNYTLIWNQLHPTAGVADFENNIWPHLKAELSHPQYLVIDNKPVLYVNDPEAIDDAANVIARLRQLVAGEGFSGITVITARVKEPYADYSFFYGNNLLDCQGDFDSQCDQAAEQAILDRFDGTRIGNMHMGWDKDPSTHRQFHDVPGRVFHQRAWRFTVPGYADMAQAFKAAMDSGTGLVNRLALSGAWDEWIEGHYIAPTRENGYGYLEGIRDAFTLADNTPYHGDPLSDGFGPYDLTFTRDVARYALDETSGTTANDSSGWDRDALLRGAPTWQPGDGHDGSGAIALDGVDDWIRLATADPGGGPGFMHDYVGLRTVSMWVKATNTTGTQVLFDQGGASYGLGLRIKNGSLQGAIRKAANLDLLSATYPPDGEWHHVALAYQSRDEDGTGDFYTRLHIDGMLVDEVRHTADYDWRMIRTHQDAAAMGARAGSDAFGDSPTGGYFEGLIDDVRIVPIELRPDEIAAIAGQPTAIVDSLSGGITYRSKGIVEDRPYYWTENASSGDHGGSVKTVGVSGRDALYTFTGSSITYVARKGSFQAKVEVLIDDISQGLFDLYAPEQQHQQPILSENVGSGTHTIRIVHTGTQNPNSQGNLINIDYLEYTTQ